MKILKNLTFLIACLCIISCSSDDDDDGAESEYPITLSFNRVEERIILYQNGAASSVSNEMLVDYDDGNIMFSVEDIENNSDGDYFKFLSDTELEVSEFGETGIAEYVFEGEYLFLLDGEGNKYLYGEGDKTKLEYRLSAMKSVTETSSSGTSSGYEDEEDIPYFPATFENSKEWHNYDFIGEINGDNYLLIQNVSKVYE